MPELAFGYLVGFIMTALLVGLHFFLQTRKFKSVEMRFVQNNLKKVGMFWSDSESDIKSFNLEAEKSDVDKSMKSILISGVGFMFLSWLGFLFQFILMLSLRYLAVRRLERNLFESQLASADLPADVVQGLIKQCNS